MSDTTIWQGPSEDIPVINADGNIFEEVQAADAAQVLFTLTSFEYTPGSNSIFVWKNGVMLRRVEDYAETSSTEITVVTPAALNDEYTFVAIAINQLIAPVVFNGLPSGGTSGQVLTKTSASDYQSEWSDPDTATTLLDAARVNIASASTVNLAAIAATTRNIQITGSTQIDGFQVSNGQVWAVKFAASLIVKNNANIVTQSGQDIRVSPNDTCLVRATADNVVELLNYARSASSMPANWNDFRLTVLTGVPVPTVDTNSANLYLTPYRGNKISLFNGSAWVLRESAEVSVAIAGATIGRPYDVFAYDNAGAVAIETLIWASATARATALTTQDGVLVKNGDTTRKYVGTVVPTGAAQLTDSERQRLVWNYYNRVDRNLLKQELFTAAWNYNTAVVRQANGSVLNQIEYVCGFQEDSIEATLTTGFLHTATGNSGSNFIGADSITAQATKSSATRIYSIVAATIATGVCTYKDLGQLGYHYLSWLEMGNGVATCTFTGSNFPSSSLMGKWRC
jgi:hypothetical protein